MKAEELRIGNWVKVGESEPFQVTGIFKEWIWALIQETDFPLKDVEPIELNQEWLIKFGFLYHGGWRDTYEVNGFELYRSPIKKGWQVERINYCPIGNHSDKGPTIEYIHQLQNLYFALTGIELKF